ncbi:MAG: DUF2281 domain-containing protein [Leptothrix sp. (in: b-proteobacteria)]
MGYAELIRTLQELPQDKQAEVFDFVDFLAARAGIPARSGADAPEPARPLAEFFRQPFRVETFQPMTRDDANAR